MDGKLGEPSILPCSRCRPATGYVSTVLSFLRSVGEHGKERDEIETSIVVQSLTVMCSDLVRPWRIFARSTDSINILRSVPFHRTVTGMLEPSLSFMCAGAFACPECGHEQEGELECRRYGAIKPSVPAVETDQVGVLRGWRCV